MKRAKINPTPLVDWVEIALSFPRKRESRPRILSNLKPWIPAFEGMTTKNLRDYKQNYFLPPGELGTKTNSGLVTPSATRVR